MKMNIKSDEKLIYSGETTNIEFDDEKGIFKAIINVEPDIFINNFNRVLSENNGIKNIEIEIIKAEEFEIKPTL